MANNARAASGEKSKPSGIGQGVNKPEERKRGGWGNKASVNNNNGGSNSKPPAAGGLRDGSKNR